MNGTKMCKLETTLRRHEEFQVPSSELLLERLTASKIMEIKPSCSSLNTIQSSLAQDACPNTEEIRNVNSFLTNGKKSISETASLASKTSRRPNVALSNKFEEKIMKSLKPDCVAVVDSLLDKIKQLSILQKALLYLKLPSSREDPDVLEPLRRPLNPLGNRQEVSQALSYIRTHFSPDPDISLPKKEIYNEYSLHCQRRKMKPLSTADFGKAMKQVYPVVRPRRLGERGNSRYCYSGLSNCGDLSRPSTAVSSQGKMSEKICNWASKMLNVNVSNLSELSKMIPNENLSDNCQEKLFVRTSLNLLDSCSDNKRKPEIGMIDTCDMKPTKQRKKSHSQKGGLKKVNDNFPSAQTQTPCTESRINVSNVCDINNQKPKEIGSLKLEPSILSFSDLNPGKSTNLQVQLQTGTKSSPQKRQRRTKKNYDVKNPDANQYKTVLLLECQTIPIRDNFELQSIEEEGSEVIKLSNTEIITEVPLKSPLLSKELPISTNICDNIVHKSDIGVDSNEAQDCDQSTSYKEIGYLPANCFGHYLQDEGNSQEPEEELLKYFKDPLKSESKVYDPDKNTSQLRLLLEPNSSGNATSGQITKPSERDTGFSEEEGSKAKLVELNNFFVLSPQPELQQAVQKTSATLGNGSKRRVSFENIPVSFSQSPNNPRKSFSFTPISPRPPTMSKSTVSVSPFVFPRETVRGKQSSLNNVHQNPVPSQALAQISPLKNMSRSTSQSSTPSPVTNARTQFSRGRSTPQDTSQDQTDLVKCSPIISPSSSSGVFLSPASPMSSCNSPVFSFRKCMSPIKPIDEIKSSPKCSTSLLQSLLMTEKSPGTKSVQVNRSNSLSQNGVKFGQALNVFQSAPEENAPSSESHPIRSQSVPVGKNSLVISPLSNTLDFPIPSFKGKESVTFLDVKPNDLEIWDTVLNDTQIENSSDHGTMDSESHAANEVSMESVFSNLYEYLNDKGISSHSTNGSLQLSQVSRSHPNTPLVYNECSNSSRDPVVSAFPVAPGSKSYPSTPTVGTHNFSYGSSTASSSAKRNINPLLDSMPGSSFDVMELQLNNLQELSGCDDAFNELAREVENNNDFTSE